MPDSIRRTEHIWMFGKRVDFSIYESSEALHETQYRRSGTNPVRKQKNQIVLHYTAANNPAENTIRYWSQHGPVTHSWVCPRYFRTTGGHNWGTAYQWRCPEAGCGWTGNGRCPTHGDREKNQCPSGHGNVIKGRIRASSQYIVEVAQNRLNTAQDYSDVIEVVDSDYVAYHAGVVNENSVGIEIANTGWNLANVRHDAMTNLGSVHYLDDANRWLRLLDPAGVGTETNLTNHPTYKCPHNDANFPNGHQWYGNRGGGRCPTHSARTPAGEAWYQAYQEEQYRTLLLLLRSLSIKHRIPRRFLGESAHEKMKRWWHLPGGASQRESRSRVMRFRGILSHMNVHDGKECGGPALHRNRLFRGIIDEWWMPVQLNGMVRPYYSGPFDLQPNTESFYRHTPAGTQSELFRDANLEALQETRSYFDLDEVEWYYANTETAQPGDQHGIGGGTFPIGRNKIWHGGVHLCPPEANRRVYAAASGTIVAAKIDSDSDVEASANYGSQRFVLIRHTVYHQTESDPDGGTRINYTADPTYFFSLYMHLAPFADPVNAVNNNNPTWYNCWVRRNQDAAPPSGVFCPDVEVSVGDWLGSCGLYRGRQLVHFEIMSRHELTVEPWDGDPARDGNRDLVADSTTIDNFVRDTAGDGIDMADIFRASAQLRNVKSHYRSEWALSSENDLAPLVPPARRASVWESLRHFMWLSDALSACSDIEAQLCDSNGFFWHYHPITFMAFVNRLILEENAEVQEPDFRNTNVTIEEGYLTRFLWRPRWRCPSNGSGHEWYGDSGQCSTHGARASNTQIVEGSADNERLRPYDISNNTYDYQFTRAQVACQGAGAHTPGPTPPERTRFSITLLDIIETIRRRYAGGNRITVNCAHLCETHSEDSATNRNQCVTGTAQALANHAQGIAVDISPNPANAANARRLWTVVEEVIEDYNDSLDEEGGDASRADLTEGFGQATITPAAAPSAVPFTMHIELVREEVAIEWESWVKKPTVAVNALVRNRGLIGLYNTQEEAQSETITTVTARGAQWEGCIRQDSEAIRAKVYAGGIIGVYNTREEAEAEKSQDVAWPKRR